MEQGFDFNLVPEQMLLSMAYVCLSGTKCLTGAGPHLMRPEWSGRVTESRVGECCFSTRES